jgi:putative membrane protein
LLSHAALNASLNATSACFLGLGFFFIRRKNIFAHKLSMLAAACASLTFLVSYVLYHLRVGSVPFAGRGWSRPAYFSLLLSHTTLAVVNVPLVAITLTRALRGRFDRHKQIARWTLPIWSYVCVTGVLVYFRLYHWFS